MTHKHHPPELMSQAEAQRLVKIVKANPRRKKPENRFGRPRQLRRCQQLRRFRRAAPRARFRRSETPP
jgi:hypothetical protein